MCSYLCSCCRKKVKHLNESHQCRTCEREFKDVAARLMERYSGVLKKLADR